MMARESKKVKEPKEVSRSLWKPLAVISVVVFSASLLWPVFYLNQTENLNDPIHPLIKEIRKKESISKQSAVEYITELIRIHPTDHTLYCEKPRILYSMSAYSEALDSLQDCWQQAQTHPDVEEDTAKMALKIAKNIYMRQPNTFNGENLSHMLQEIAHVTNNNYALYLAGFCLCQESKWEQCEEVGMEAVSHIDEKTSFGFQQMVYYQLITSCVEQQKFVEALQIIRGLIAEDSLKKELWRNDWRILEFQTELLSLSSHTTTQLQNAIYTLEKRFKSMNRDLIQHQVETNAASALYSLEGLYRKVDDDVSANAIGIELWNTFWKKEAIENPLWECYGTPKVVSNYTAEDGAELVILPEYPSKSSKQFHSNLEILSEDPVKKSNKFDKPIHPHELFAYKLKNAKVQYSSYDKDMILASTDCTLHGYANQIASLPPIGFATPKHKNVVLVSNGILLHWKPLELQNWIVQCLPKLIFLIENDWLGEYESTVFLPYSPDIQEYIELLLIEDERITWLRRDRIYEVKQLTIFDYRPTNPKIPLSTPCPPLHLLQSLRESLLGEELDLEVLDIILVLRDKQKSTLQSNELVGALQEAMNDVKISNSLLDYLQVIEIEPHGTIYHQIFAYKRARAIIGGDANFLANAAWMSKRAAVIDVASVPLQLTPTAVLSSMLQLDYHIVPTSHPSQTDKISAELHNLQEALKQLFST